MTHRQFAIGDIHGDLDSLKNLISSLQLDETDELVFLGDYVDRGPNSKGVIDFLVELDKKHKCTFIYGNHEEYMIHAILKGDKAVENFWMSGLMRGGKQTLESYGVETVDELREVIPQSHIDFLKKTVRALETETHVFAHAGWDPTKPASEQDANTLRYRFLREARPDPKFKKRIVTGHSALITGKPATKGNILCIDTVQAGWLTAYDVKNNAFYQANKKGDTRRFKEPEVFDENVHVPEFFRRKPAHKGSKSPKR